MGTECSARAWGSTNCVGAILFGDYQCRQDEHAQTVETSVYHNRFDSWVRTKCTMPTPSSQVCAGRSEGGHSLRRQQKCIDLCASVDGDAPGLLPKDSRDTAGVWAGRTAVGVQAVRPLACMRAWPRRPMNSDGPCHACVHPIHPGQ